MKVLLLSVLTTVSLLAIEAKVKYDEVTLSIDGKKHTYQKGKHFTVDYNQTICFLKGDGVISFSDEKTALKKQLDKNTKNCMTMTKIVQQKEDGFLASILRFPPKTNESVEDGAGLKGGKDDIYSEDIVLSDIKEEYILISNSKGKWTTPIELEILEKGMKTINIEYKNDAFLVPVNILEVGQNIKIKGKFAGTVLDVKVR